MDGPTKRSPKEKTHWFESLNSLTVQHRNTILRTIEFIGLGVAGYGLLMIAYPSQYAQQFVSLEHAPFLGFGLLILGMCIALTGVKHED